MYKYILNINNVFLTRLSFYDYFLLLFSFHSLWKLFPIITYFYVILLVAFLFIFIFFCEKTLLNFKFNEFGNEVFPIYVFIEEDGCRGRH